MVWPWSLFPLTRQPDTRPSRAQTGRLAKTITIRPDARTENQSWPCRELNYHRTPNHRCHHSRLTEYLQCRNANRARVILLSFRHHLADWRNFRAALASAAAAAKLCKRPGFCAAGRKALFKPSHDFNFKGANDEY